LIVSQQGAVRSTSQKKARKPLCPARGGLGLRGAALGKLPFLPWHKLAQQTLVCCPFLGKQKVTGVTNRAIFGGGIPHDSR